MVIVGVCVFYVYIEYYVCVCHNFVVVTDIDISFTHQSLLSEGVVSSSFNDTLVICRNFFIGLSGRQFVQVMSSTKDTHA